MRRESDGAAAAAESDTRYHWVGILTGGFAIVVAIGLVAYLVVPAPTAGLVAVVIAATGVFGPKGYEARVNRETMEFLRGLD